MIIFDIIYSLLKVVPGSKFSTSMMMFILSCLKFLSKDVVILEIRNCDGSLNYI